MERYADNRSQHNTRSGCIRRITGPRGPSFEGTRFLSRLWGAIFVVSILLAVFGTNTLELIVLPNLLVVLALVFGPRIGHWYAIRFSPKGAE